MGEKSYILTLKSGVRIGGLRGLGEWLSLHDLLELVPEQFESLLAIARGAESATVPPTHLRELKSLGYIDHQSEEIRFDSQQVLLASYRKTETGHALDNPFDLTAHADQAIFRELIGRMERNARKFFQGGEDPPPLP